MLKDHLVSADRHRLHGLLLLESEWLNKGWWQWLISSSEMQKNAFLKIEMFAEQVSVNCFYRFVRRWCDSTWTGWKRVGTALSPANCCCDAVRQDRRFEQPGTILQISAWPAGFVGEAPDSPTRWLKGRDDTHFILMFQWSLCTSFSVTLIKSRIQDATSYF